MTKLSRRDFLKITAFFGGAIATNSLVADKLSLPLFVVKETRWLMGTVVHLSVVSPDQTQAESALKTTFNEMQRQILIFDHRNPLSPLGILNRTGELSEAPAELVDVIRRASEFSRLSDGAFDITIKPVVDARARNVEAGPALLSLVDYRAVEIKNAHIGFARPHMQITLDGIAKGTVVDGGVAALKAAGCSNVLVEAGGDLLVNGTSATHDGWRIGVTHPRQELVSGYLAAFTLAHGAAATSGDYYQALTPDRSQNHIVDPRSGVSPFELASATVLAADATSADALATAIMVLGVESGLQLANSLTGVEALVVTKDMLVRKTVGFPDLA